MQKYFQNLLVLSLGASASLIMSPCQAQTPAESQDKSNNNISSISSTSPSNIELGDSTTLTKSESPRLTETAINSSSSTDVNAIKPEPRIPISSRIFIVPSMQQ